MPPSEKTSRAAIVEAALAVVEAEGLAALTARRVASELNLSTAPVYGKFDSMEALARAVMERARDLLVSYTERGYTDRAFLDIGTGIAMFAKEHPRLYRALFLESGQFESIVNGFLEHLTEEMRRDQRFVHLPRKPRVELVHRMWTYTHGLASMIAVGLAHESSREAVIRSLSAVGGAVIADVLKDHPRP
jgi:AcrR family transcriptional regulator